MTVELSCSAILFDLDGVLVFSEASVLRSWTAWAERHGIALADVLAASRGQRSVDTIHTVAPKLDAAEEAARLEAEQAIDIGDVRAGQGAADLLGTLAVGEWAVVTSGTAPLATARLRVAGLPIPDVLVTAEEVSDGKPDPAGYLLASRGLGRKPADCVVVEDAAAGVEAGRRAGMRVIGVTNGDGMSHLAAADVLVDSCADITIRRDATGEPGTGFLIRAARVSTRS
jgi:mannitol-1-/sugar-/sorbitol-6-phosphatase